MLSLSLALSSLLSSLTLSSVLLALVGHPLGSRNSNLQLAPS